MDIIAGEKPKELLLHTCCGPCSIEPLRLLQQEGWHITIAYANSNIQPRGEYAKRLETLMDFAKSQGVRTIEGIYDPASWRENVACYSQDKQARCRACYRMRLAECALIAKRECCNALSTTLTVSPYQYTQVIREELLDVAQDASLTPVFRDFREHYPQATRLSRELGMYRQNYCGCPFSYEEAERERQERREERSRLAAKRAEERAAKEALQRAEIEAKKLERKKYDDFQRQKRAIRDELRGIKRRES